MVERILGVDTETTGLDFVRHEVHRVGLLRSDGRWAFLPMAEGLRLFRVWQRWADAVVGHNIKFDARLIQKYGFVFDWRKVVDTIAMCNMVAEQERSKSLLALSLKYLDYSGAEDVVLADFISAHPAAKGDYSFIPNTLLEPYTKRQLANTMALYVKWRAACEGYGTLWETEQRLTETLYEMELRGVRIDIEALRRAQVEYDKECRRMERKMRKLGAPKGFLPSSPPQVARMLEEHFKLPLPLTDKGNPSTSVVSLDRYWEHPFVQALVRWRKLRKLSRTYVDGLIERSYDGIIRTNYRQAGTRTGRLSSTDPNLQNIPHAERDAIHIKRAFVPREGYHNYAADYSSMQLRLIAGTAGDEKAITMLESGVSLHDRVAKMITGKEKYTIGEYFKAKSLNFGIPFGASIRRVAFILDAGDPEATGQGGPADLRVSQDAIDRARHFMDDYAEQFPGLAQLRSDLQNQLMRDGFIADPMGRKYRIPYRWRYKVINALVQGMEANIIKEAMVRLQEVFKGTGANLLLQVHDELDFEIPIGEERALLPQIKEAMEAPGSDVLPISTPTEIERWEGSWADKQQIDPKTGNPLGKKVH